MRKIGPDLAACGSEYGAPMGRAACRSEELTGKVRLQRVRLNQDGYDAGGAYWGVGKPLYWAADDGDMELWLRAWNRTEAKQHVLSKYPSARFYR